MVEYVENAIIWSFSREEILEICWLNDSDFSWKVIVDFWVWASWFLSFLSTDESTRKYEVDPIYRSEDLFEDLRKRTYAWYAQNIVEAITFWAPEYVVAREKELVDRVFNAKFDPGITRKFNLWEIWESIDILFSISTVSTFPNPVEFLEEAQDSLSEEWDIYLVEPLLDKQWNYIDFLVRNISSVKWVLIRKNRDNWWAMVKIPKNVLKRVITISKRFKKDQD